jgi:tetratricopeptide (TPR) repeat protein
VRPIRIAILLVVTAGTLVSCRQAIGVARSWALEIAHRLPVDDSSLTIPIDQTAMTASSGLNPLAVRGLVKRGEFARLDSLFVAVEDTARRDVRKEYFLFDAYDAMSYDTALVQPLRRWIRERPTSAPARIALANYLVELGWEERGNGYARDTPRKWMRLMQQHFREAKTNLDTALTLAPQSAAAYRLLMEMTKVTPDTAASRQYLEKGLAEIPASFALRRQQMRNLIPRWGGSYDAMKAVADAADSMATTNPRLHSLAGYIVLDSAEMLELAGRRGEALAGYTRALTYGDEPAFYMDRGQLLFRMRRYREALADLDIVVDLWPAYEGSYYWRGMAREGLWRQIAPGDRGAAKGALTDYQHAVLLGPSDPFALDRLVLLYIQVQ